MSDTPRFSRLGHEQGLALLARNHVGRLAFSFRDQVDIQPLSYVHEKEWLYGRTEIGAKLVSLSHNRWCAFEVDEVRGTFDWDSVVVRGSFEILDPEVGSIDAYHRAFDLLQEIVPEIFTRDDPSPARMILFRIHIDELTGRSARP